jgi:hypothetical protein
MGRRHRLRERSYASQGLPQPDNLAGALWASAKVSLDRATLLGRKFAFDEVY